MLRVPALGSATRLLGRGRPPFSAAAMLIVLLCMPLIVLAQGSDPPVGSTVEVSNTGTSSLNLRESPSQGATIVARLSGGTRLEVVGAGRSAEGLRWLQVRTSDGTSGWAAADFLTVVSTPTPTPRSQSPTSTPRETSSQSATATPERTSTPVPAATPQPGSSLEVDARVKVPETSDSEQGVIVTVTREGQPVEDVLVTVIVQNVDPPIVRELEPTDDEGVTSKTIEVKGEKGTITVVAVAVHPDGGRGWDAVSYFRR
jgi:hypothetical protein